jgi:hypothetical protein
METVFVSSMVAIAACVEIDLTDFYTTFGMNIEMA